MVPRGPPRRLTIGGRPLYAADRTLTVGGFMSFAFLQTYHPQIVHTPIVLLIFSAFFGILGRLLDRDWLRKTSVMLLVFGFLGAWLAVQSGTAAHKVPEHQQGV